MANERSLTRDRLLDAALARFSTHGWAGTSIRALSQDVGIRESSVYKHFSSKQAVFDALLARAESRLAEVADGLEVSITATSAAPGYRDITADRLVEVAHGFFDAMLHDPELRDLRRLFITNQYRDPEIGRRLRGYWLEAPLTFHTELFSSLFTTEDFRPGLDPQATAVAFFGPIWFLLQYADSPGADSEQQARQMLAAHIRDFRATRLRSRP